jgi:hypothetical protein
MSDRYFGVNSRVLESSLFKQTLAVTSGKNNLAGLCTFLDSLDFVPEAILLSNQIKAKFVTFDSSLSAVSPEFMGQSLEERVDQISRSMGLKCMRCGKRMSMFGHRVRFCSCGGRFRSVYGLELHKLADNCVDPEKPEAVLMNNVWDCLAEAYVLGYKAVRVVLQAFVEQYGLSSPFDLVDSDLKDRFDGLFYMYEQGETRISAEEREVLMFLVRGNFAGIGLADAENVIRAAIDVCKFGHLQNKLRSYGADLQYEAARAKFSGLYNYVNERIRKATVITREQRVSKPVVVVSKAVGGEFYPVALLPKSCWGSGKLSRYSELQPLDKGKLTVYSDVERVALNCYVSRSGGGKTTFLGSVLDHAINWGHEYVLSVLADEKNSLYLSNLPVFPVNSNCKKLMRVHEEMGVSGLGLPTLNIAFMRDDDDITKNLESLNHSLPPTIFSRVVLIDDPSSFGLEFKTGKSAKVEGKRVIGNRGLLNVLEEWSKELGFGRVCGLINVVNCLRKESVGSGLSKGHTKPEIQIGTELLYKFVAFRQENKSPSARIYLDELSRFAPITHSVAGTDTSMSSSTFNESIKAMRGANTSVDAATQKWNEIHPEAKSEVRNLFFRNLKKSSDRSHSQRDLVLGSMDLVEGDNDKALVNQIIESRQFPDSEHLWFWYNDDKGDIQVIKPMPPRFMLNQPDLTNLQIFRAYDKWFEGLRDGDFGERMFFKKYSGFYRFLGSEDGSVLLKSWFDVPKLHYPVREHTKKFYGAK